MIALRLTDGGREIAYAIAEPLDIVAIPAELAPVAVGSPVEGLVAVAGVAMIDGDPVEVIDAHRLFAGHRGAPLRRPLCLLRDDGGGWLTSFLAPALEAAGYRCAAAAQPGEPVALALTLDDAEPLAGVPCVRLSSAPAAPGRIYRYDRQALLGAIAECGPLRGVGR